MKNPLKSKTIWAGLIYFVLGFFDWALGNKVTCTIGGAPGGPLLMLIGGLNIFLRFVTDGKVTFKEKSK